MLRLLFLGFVALTAVHVGLVLSHEPFAFDAWNVARDTAGQPFSLANFFDYGIGQYTHSNPRVGQWLTYLAYKLDDFAVIATPLAYLALTAAITTLGIGRLPAWRRGRDLALWVLAIGFAWFVLPRLGMLMFCRAYSTNYVYGAAIQLWFLVPLRLRPSGEGRIAACVPYFFLGVIAGASNEHTGPTLVIFTLSYAAWRYRHAVALPNLALSGAAGSVVGFAMIFFAPGQGERYDGLGTKVGFVGRLLQRGLTGNLEIVGDFIVAAGPVLGLIAIVLVIGARDPERDGQRGPLQRLGWTIAAGLLVTATLFVSPKLGPRFYLAPCALLLAALLGLADTVLVTPRRLAPFVVFAVLASGYAALRSLPLYQRLDEASLARIYQLETSKVGSVVTVDAFDQIEDSWWFLGDDFRDAKKREMVTDYFGLSDVIFRAVDVDVPLGVSDARIVPVATTTPASCLDAAQSFAMGPVRGLDIASVRRAASTAVDRMRAKLGGKGRIERVDLNIDFLGARPELPRASLLVGRWTPDGLVGWAGVIEREGTSRKRRLVLPRDLRAADLEILIYSVGHDWKSLGPSSADHLSYEPWRRGAYWALACRPTECFVVAATRML